MRLEASRACEAMQAHLLAGRIALSRHSMPQADPHLERAARSRRIGPPLPRSVAWLARARQADARGDARTTVAACARGLDALEEHQMRLGATELRAYGTAHGAELATLAQRDALRRGNVRRLLFWSERWRATALAARSASPREDKELAAELEALRSVSRRSGRPRWLPRAGMPWSASGGGSRRRSRRVRAGCPAATSPGRRVRPGRALRRARPEHADRARHGGQRAARGRRRGPAGAPAHGGQRSRARGPNEPLRVASPRPWSPATRRRARAGAQRRHAGGLVARRRGRRTRGRPGSGHTAGPLGPCRGRSCRRCTIAS